MDDDEDAPPGRLLPPDDRLWRHPSEVGEAARVVQWFRTAAAGPHRLRHRWRVWRSRGPVGS